MSWWEILIIVAAAAFVVGVAIYSIVRKKQGKNSCGCDCGCSGCNGCPSQKREKK